jgi:hypothetical protein
MFSKMKAKAGLSIAAIVLAISGSALAAGLTTEELTRLKTSGVGEDVIRFMLENGYGNVDRVVKLKEAGFADETISTVIKTDLKGEKAATPPPAPAPVQATSAPSTSAAAAPAVVQPTPTLSAATPAAAQAEARAILQTPAKVRIEHYQALGDPVVLNTQDIKTATVSLLEGRILKIEWDPSKVSRTLGNLFLGKPFENPFYWDLEQGDTLVNVSPKDNAFVLRTARFHQGRPKVNKSHYWLLYLTPQSPELAKQLQSLVSQ